MFRSKNIKEYTPFLCAPQLRCLMPNVYRNTSSCFDLLMLYSNIGKKKLDLDILSGDRLR